MQKDFSKSMPTFHLLITSPEKNLFNESVVSATFLGADGYFEILANHAALIAVIKSGTVEITDKEQEKHFIEIQGGFLEFLHNKATLLCYPSS